MLTVKSLNAFVQRSCSFSRVSKISLFKSSAEEHHISIEAMKTARLTSPFYPTAYPKNVDMKWILRTEPGYKIRISFREVSSWGSEDVLRAGDGGDPASNQFLIFQWDAYDSGPDLLSSGNVMWLRFTSTDNWKNFGRANFVLLVHSVPSAGRNVTFLY